MFKLIIPIQTNEILAQIHIEPWTIVFSFCSPVKLLPPSREEPWYNLGIAQSYNSPYAHMLVA